MKNYCPHCLHKIEGVITEKRIVERYLVRYHCGFRMDDEITKKVLDYLEAKKKEEKRSEKTDH